MNQLNNNGLAANIQFKTSVLNYNRLDHNLIDVPFID